MRQSARLTKSDEIQRVRLEGHTVAHPALVVGFLKNQCTRNRTAVIAGRSVGGAVQRNLAKRRMRSALQTYAEHLDQGYDLVLIARKPILTYPYAALQVALKSLLRRAELLKDEVN